MSHDAWVAIKQAKGFYVKTYRKVKTILFYSLGCNVILILGIFYVHTHHPPRDFYASSGVTAPVKLQPLLAPNKSSTPLLPESPVDLGDEFKPIPN